MARGRKKGKKPNKEQKAQSLSISEASSVVKPNLSPASMIRHNRERSRSPLSSDGANEDGSISDISMNSSHEREALTETDCNNTSNRALQSHVSAVSHQQNKRSHDSDKSYITISKHVGNNIVEVKSAGRNEITVSLNNYEKANSILNLADLKAHNLKASIPAFRVMRTGVIKNVPLEVTDEMILNEFNSTAKIVSVRRLHRKIRKDDKDVLTPTLSVLAKFQGQLLPRALTFMHVSFPVLPYIPRVLMCFACLRFGHISSDCKSAACCAKCGQNRHTNQEDCPRHQLSPIRCNCGQEHLPSSVRCPVYIKQRQVYQYAALENVCGGSQ
ncbi:uncharacterized protein [Mycetomoellerius zeteki]|uniref:uncharacterized protein n=1 Tax=Mycetomoellerius zeteki TaxID=64791 RepID=UPI00084EBFC9|nr:PREDICTED: uncharacterized protein LOC108726277 [Trachymyrmex zeteki]